MGRRSAAVRGRLQSSAGQQRDLPPAHNARRHHWMYHVHRWYEPPPRGASKMGSVEDHKIKTAQETLQSRLEEVFDNTSTDCQEKLEELGYPPLIGEGTEGDF